MASENAVNPSAKKSTTPLAAAALIVIIIAAVVLYSFSLPSSPNTTTTITANTSTSPTTVPPPPPPLPLQALTMPANALYGLPMQQMFIAYNTSYYVNIWSHVQYGLNFTNPFFNSSFTPSANYTIPVPAQYANLTSPFGDVVSVWVDSSPSIASTNYESRNSAMCANINAIGTMRVITNGIGQSATYCNGTNYYGSSTEAVMFLTGNYTAEIILFGVEGKLSPSYLNVTAQHLYSQITQ